MSDLDPQVGALLEQLHANQDTAANVPISKKIASMRKRMRMCAAVGIALEPVATVKDFDIPSHSIRVPVRLYVPHSTTTVPRPALVYYHGGSFVSGDLESHDTLLRALANRGECIVLSVAYRLAPENPYPAANDDATAALEWIIDLGPDLGVDPRRVAVGGDSAGGLLAAWVAQKAKAIGTALRLQVLLYPNLDATISMPSWKEFGGGDYLISRSQMLEYFDAYLPRGVRRDDPQVSPLFARDLTGLAPALVITADHDPLHDEGDEYASRLTAAGVRVQHILWPGMIHGFASFAGVLDAGKAVIDKIGAALREAFE